MNTRLSLLRIAQTSLAAALFVACSPPEPSARTPVNANVVPATSNAKQASNNENAFPRTLIPFAPRAPVPVTLFNGAFRAMLESDGPVTDQHDPTAQSAIITPKLPFPATCTVFRDGDFPFPAYVASILRSTGDVRGTPTVRVEPARNGVAFFLSAVVKPGDEPTFVLSFSGVVGERKSVSCVAFGGAIESDLDRVTRGLWESAQWTPGSDPEITTSLHFYRVRDGARTTGLASRRAFRGSDKGENERGAQMFSFDFDGESSEFRARWHSSVQYDDSNGEPRRIIHVGAEGATGTKATVYARVNGVWQHEPHEKPPVPLPNAPTLGTELGLREHLQTLATTPGAPPFTYASAAFFGTKDGKPTTTFSQVTLSHVRPGVVDEADLGGDHDLLEVDREGVVFRETHFVKDGKAANDAHVREITERISHYVRAGNALVLMPE